jgi:TonB-linked SusC/RagA family outer membrane protein
MTLKQALLSGCALALLTFEAQAQEQETATPPAQPEAAAPAAPAAEAEGRTVKGTVVDALTREGVPLARVIIKGTRRGVETEVDGTFSLTIPNGPVTLHISSQDHKAREVTVSANQAQLTIPMEASFMEEMVVVGRASELARKHMANSVASVKGEDLTRAPVATVDQALQGKVAGANIQSNSGAPGGGLQMRLRGVSTINGESNPLYVVDGVVINDVAIASGVFAVTASIGGSNPNPTQDNQVNRIADLNPNDIESIEVLKGASAAAIYGSKASNGVVIITTKRGRAGEPRVDITQRVGIYSLSNKMGSRVFEDVEEAVAQFGEKARQYYTPNTFFDHEQLVAGRSDLSTETLASMSGQAGNTRYFVSGLVKNDEGVVNNTGYEKQGLRLNLTQQLGEALEVNATANLLHSLGQRGLTNNDNAGVTTHMVLPFMPSFWDSRADENGLYPSNPFLGSRANALQTMALMRNDEDVWRFLGSTDATLTVFKTDTQSLRVLGNFGADRFQQKNELFFPPALHFELVDDGQPGTSLFATSEALNLNTGINIVHTMKPLPGVSTNTSAGFQAEQRSVDSTYIVSRNLNGGQPNVDMGTQVGVRQDRILVRDRGFYLQEEALMLDERLTLVGALRGESSSNNGNPYQLFFYPKLATAYRLLNLAPFANELKVRVAYGETGNLPVFGSKYTPMLATGNTDGNPGLIGGGVAGDPNIRPERQREFELGLDALLFNGDAVVELTLYQRTINDLLLRRTLAPSQGFSTQVFNGGELQNRGVEVMLQLTPVHDGNFEWVSNTTFALNRSMVTDLPVPAFNAGGFGVGLGAFRIEEGQSVTQIIGNAGLNPDGTCCVVRKIGDTEPDFRMSFANTLRYQQLSLSFLLDWQQGSSIINLTRFIYDLAGTSRDYETAGQQRLKDQATNTSVYVEDASFLKLREVTLTYQFPESFVRSLPKVRSARISLSGRNLLTFTRYSGLDPEVSNFGNQSIARNIDVAPFPPSRSFWTSIDLGF